MAVKQKPLSLLAVKRILKPRIDEGYEYDEALSFIYGKGIRPLSKEAEEAIKRFSNMCERGECPEIAYERAFKRAPLVN